MNQHVQQIYDAWGNRASVKEPDSRVNGDRYFKVGGYGITVSDDPEQPIKVASLYNKWGAETNPMPNMSFSDGEMRIPIEDLVDLILRRVPAEELAEGLWRDDEVRERFVYCMANRYAGPVEDADRRKLLTEIQVEIYAKAIDRAIERLEKSEAAKRARDDYYRWKAVELGHYEGLYRRYYETLNELWEAGRIEHATVQKRLALHSSPEQLAEYIKEHRDPVVTESVGPQWHESRDYWRKRLEEFFPEPPDPAPDGIEEGGAL